MTRRLLFALCICLVFAIAPAALAYDDQDTPPGEPACSAGFAEEDDGCEAGEDEDPWGGDGTGDPEGEEDTAGDDDPADDEDPADADQPCGTTEEGEDEPGEEPVGDDELGAPDVEAETTAGYRDFCEAPVFDRGFLRRKWRLSGEAGGFGGGVLTVAVASIPRVPARFREQAAQLAGLELAVVVSRRTKLSRTRPARGARRRGDRRMSPGALRRARRVKVEGKLLPPSRWRRDAEGLRVPTLRATRITVAR